MDNGHSDIGVAAPASPQAAAYKGLLDQLEQVLPSQDFADATEAYEQYADAYAQAVSDPAIRQRVSSASQRLTEALNRALEDSQVRGTVQEATTEYLRLIEESWPSLTSEGPDGEAFTAVATGMTTLAYLYGLGRDDFIERLGATSPFAPATPEGPWSRHLGSGQAEDTDDSLTSDDDDIVWQEFSVGEDGQIVQRAVPSKVSSNRSGGSRPVGAPDAAPRHSDGNDPSAAAKAAGSARQAPANARRSGHAGTHGDPAKIIENAYADYVEGLRLAGASLPTDSDGLAPPRRAGGVFASQSQPELHQQVTELITAYLGLAQGMGYVPDPYLSYCRLLANATELAERQVALVHSYERLLERAAQGKRAGSVKQAVDTQYRRFLTAVRAAWSEVDPSSLPPEQLSAMTASTARAASLYQTAINKSLFPP